MKKKINCWQNNRVDEMNMFSKMIMSVKMIVGQMIVGEIIVGETFVSEMTLLVK